MLYNDYCSDKDLIIKSHEKGRKLDRIKLEPEEYQLLLASDIKILKFTDEFEHQKYFRMVISISKLPHFFSLYKYNFKFDRYLSNRPFCFFDKFFFDNCSRIAVAVLMDIGRVSEVICTDPDGNSESDIEKEILACEMGSIVLINAHGII